MKRHTLLFFLTLASSLLFGRTDSIPGYYVTLEGDTLPAYFDPRSRKLKNEFFYSCQYEIRIIEENGKSKKLSPYDIKAYSLYYPEDTLSYCTYIYSYEEEPGKYVDEKRFFLVERKDYLTLLRHYYLANHSHNTGPGGVSFTYQDTKLDYEVIKEGEERISYFSNFKKHYTAYFSDCQEISSKIKDKTYRKKDLPKIAEEYNYWYYINLGKK